MSDVESDTEKGSTDGTSCLISSASPEPLIHAYTDPIKTETATPHISTDNSNSFVSELVSDQEPAQPLTESRFAASVGPEEETLPEDGKVNALCARADIPLNQSDSPDDPKWSNVDLAEAQGQQAQTGAQQDSADTCSLSSVTTYTSVMEDLCGVDERPLWAWVSGGGCSVNGHSQLTWFNSSLNSSCELNEIVF